MTAKPHKDVADIERGYLASVDKAALSPAVRARLRRVAELEALANRARQQILNGGRVDLQDITKLEGIASTAMESVSALLPKPRAPGIEVEYVVADGEHERQRQRIEHLERENDALRRALADRPKGTVEVLPPAKSREEVMAANRAKALAEAPTVLVGAPERYAMVGFDDQQRGTAWQSGDLGTRG